MADYHQQQWVFFWWKCVVDSLQNGYRSRQPIHQFQTSLWLQDPHTTTMLMRANKRGVLGNVYPIQPWPHRFDYRSWANKSSSFLTNYLLSWTRIFQVKNCILISVVSGHFDSSCRRQGQGWRRITVQCYAAHKDEGVFNGPPHNMAA